MVEKGKGIDQTLEEGEQKNGQSYAEMKKKEIMKVKKLWQRSPLQCQKKEVLVD